MEIHVCVTSFNMRCRQKVTEMDCPEFSVPPLTLPLSVFLSDKDPRDHIFPFLILIFNFICLWRGGGCAPECSCPWRPEEGVGSPKSWSYWGLVVVSYMTWVLETDFSFSVEICLLLTPEPHASPGVIFFYGFNVSLSSPISVTPLRLVFGQSCNGWAWTSI